MGKLSTKDKILDVAIDLFSQRGYFRVTVREIAEGVGIKESSIYNHYSKKEDILQSILDYYKEENKKYKTYEDLEEDITGKNPRIIYRESLKRVKDHFMQKKAIKIARLLFIESFRNPPIRELFLEEMIDRPMRFWTSFFKKLIDKKVITPQNPRKLAESYHSYVILILFESLILEYSGDPDLKKAEKNFNKVEDHFYYILNLNKVKNDP